MRRRTQWLALALWILVNWLFSLLLLIIFVEQQPEVQLDNPTHLIVLGAGLTEQGQPRRILQARLERALVLLQQQPGLQVVVSGGQGADEPVTEAAAMRDYLQQRGIAPGRILLEQTSRSTRENLLFSRDLLRQQPSPLGGIRPLLVTSDFHLYRASMLARHVGWYQIAGAKASTPWWLLLSHWPREYFALFKDLVVRDLLLDEQGKP